MKRKFLSENTEGKKKSKSSTSCPLTQVLNQACETFDWYGGSVIHSQTRFVLTELEAFYNLHYDSLLENVVPYIVRKYSEGKVRQTCFGGWIFLTKTENKYQVLQQNVQTCPKSIKIFFDIGFFQSAESTSGHANMLIIDRKEKTVELFDPHGSDVSLSEVKSLMIAITNFLMSHGYREEMTSFEKLGPLDLCPERPYKWQTKVETCRWFSSLYLVARLLCPFVSRSEIIEMFLSTGTESEQELMTKFYCFLALNAAESNYEGVISMRSKLLQLVQAKSVPLRALQVFETWIRAGLPSKALAYGEEIALTNAFFLREKKEKQPQWTAPTRI
jgi:hypothetical protein